MSDDHQYKKLPKAVRKRWVSALKSGEYQQARGALHNKDGGFCCLGVLIDVNEDGYWDPAYAEDRYYFVTEGDGVFSDTSLEQATLNSTGLDFEAEARLIDMNDEGSSFEEIAEWIEENL